MIGSLRGIIIKIHPAFALLEVNGIGFALKASIPTLASMKVGEEKLVYVHDHVREDARDLYAFATHEELQLFERLLAVSGVGPKVALTIMSAGPLETVRRAIMAGDLATLTSVPGVGTKTAQKIVLELKGQLVEREAAAPVDREVIDALVSLGYTSAQAREAVRRVDPAVTEASERVRQALRNLSP